MRNITGAPVEGSDYFERPRELAALTRELKNAANIRINAPRRLGKTSLVLRLCEEWRSQGGAAVFVNVEDTVDELSLTEKLLEALRSAGLQPDLSTRCLQSIEKVRSALGPAKVATGAGIDLVLEGAGGGAGLSLGRALENVISKVEQGEKHVLIAIDEMPEALLALSKVEGGSERVARFLHWLRALRQSFRRKVRWVFLGSIGMDGFVEERLLGKTINDLTSVPLDALSEEEALAFLSRLAADNGLKIAEEQQREIIERVGWPLPYHLQIAVHAFLSLGVTTVDQSAIEQAWNHLLRPESLTQFDTWRQKLDEQFSVPMAANAKAVLNHVCQFPDGRSRGDLLSVLVAMHPSKNPDDLAEILARLLQLLQRDGFLLEKDSSYSFRSFLLREYWYRRNIR